MRLLAVVAAVLALILIPFVLWEDAINQVAAGLVERGRGF